MKEERHIPPLLRVKNLKTWFSMPKPVFSRAVAPVRAVDGVFLHINQKETLGLVGESGCGKTTLGRTILGLEKPVDGKIYFSGEKIVPPDAGPGMKQTRNLRRRMQVVFQDPLSSLNPRMNVMDIVTEGLSEFGMIRKKEKAAAAMRLMGIVGLDEKSIYRFPHEFSGGQRQRINIARAVSVNPELIICDEAVSALDVSVQAQVINLFRDLAEEFGLSYLFISHDLSVVRNIADRVAVMYLGRIVEEGRCGDVIFNPLHPYTRALIDAIPVAGEKKRHRSLLSGDASSSVNPPSGCGFHPRCPEARPACRTKFPDTALIEGDVPHRVACHLYS